MLIGKSVGTYAAAFSADFEWPAIWLSPLLTSDWVVWALGRLSAPTLLVGGSADPHWDRSLARELCGNVLEVEDADHELRVPDSLSASAAVVDEVVFQIESFLDFTVWPIC